MIDSFDKEMMRLALSEANKHTCPKRKVGAVFTKGFRVVSTGCNGTLAPKNCLVSPCNGAAHAAGSNKGLCEATHAEMVAIATIRAGDADTLYVTTQPCRECSTVLVQYHLKRVVFLTPYYDNLGIAILTDSGVIVEHCTEELPIV